MALPLKITCFDPGLGGVPTTTNPRDLSGWADSYSDSLLNELGCETARITGRVPSIEAAIDWTQRLMAAIEVYAPSGRGRFFGFLHEVSIPALECSVSLTDMANAVIVRYSDPDGKKGTQTATNSGSIAKFGRKELILNFSTAYAAEATNRAATVLAQLAYPPNKETVSVDKVDGGDGVEIELTFRGWAEALKWLTTSSTTTATAVTSTQVTSLIATYNSTNAFFDTAAAAVTATGFSATQYCDPDTTCFERIATLLAAGNSAQQRVAWGFYTRAITIAASASATPDTIAYSYSKRTRTLRDASGNVIPPWDWLPNVMIQNVDAIEPPYPSGTLATLTRKYIKRVTLSVDASGKVFGTLEPDDPDKLPEFLAKPVSATSGVSARHAQIESRIVRAARIRTISTDNSTIYNEGTGVLNPAAGGTGTVNVGTISNTGGGNIDLGTGAGIGGAGSSAALGTGTAGRVAEWLSTSTLQAATLIKSGAGVLTLSASGAFTLTVPATGTAALGTGSASALAKWSGTNTLTAAVEGTDYPALSHTHPASDVVSGTMATARLGSGTANSSSFLRGDSTWEPLTATDVAAAPDSATYIVQVASAGLSAEQSLGALATGLLKNTTTTGVLSIAAAADLPNHASRHADGGADEVALDASQTTTGTMATARLGSGTANSGAFLRGDQTWQAITTITPSVIGAAPDDAKYIVQTASAGLSAEQSLGALATGLLKNTTTTGVLSIAVAGDLPSHNHAAADITSGTMATARLGSGTATAATVLFGDSTWAALAAGDLPAHVHAAADTTSGEFAAARLGSGAAGIGTFLRGDQTWAAVPAGITGSGTANQLAIFNGTSTLTSDTDLRFDGTRMAIGTAISSTTRVLIEGTGTTNATYGLRVTDSGGTNNFFVWDDGSVQLLGSLTAGVDISAGNAVQTVSGVRWDLGGWTTGADQLSNGFVTVTIAGTVRRLMTRA